MGWLKSTGKILAGTAYLAGKATIATAKVTGHALHGTAKFVGDHRQEIADATKAAVNVAGKLVEGTGAALSSGARAASGGLHRAADESSGKTGKVLGKLGGYTADAVDLVGGATKRIGSVTRASAPALGGATGGVVSGLLEGVSGAVDSVTITDRDIERLRHRLTQLAPAAQELAARRLAAINAAERSHKKKELLDLLVVGGVSLAEVAQNPSRVPPEVERAFGLAYPGLTARGETFSEVVNRLSADELVGFVSSVKGKLFEIELVEHLNDGHLPEGMRAALAPSATQPGYDIRVTNEHGHVVDVIQAKATESVEYVKDALERYPDIDVTTTTEVHAQLVARGIGQVTDSGISEAVLQGKIEAAAAGGHLIDAGDVMPSSIGLAVIALSSFMDKGLSQEQRGAEFGGRAAKAGLSGVAANAALVASGTWWIGLTVGIGSRWLVAHGGGKRERYEALKRTVAAVERQVAKNIALRLPSPGRSIS
jgi:hypothetical protein